MTIMDVSVAEMLRVAPWSLRALGFSYGVAERGASLVALAEAIGRAGLAGLRIKERALIDSSSIPMPVRRRTQLGLTIEATGKSLIEIGPVTIDLLSAHALTRGVATACLTGIIDSDWAATVITFSAAYGLTAVAVDRKVPGDAEPTRWAISMPSDFGTLLLEGTDEDELRSALLSLRLAGAHSDLVLDESPQAKNAIDLMVIRHAETVSGRLDRSKMLNVSERWATANRMGIKARASDVAYLYALERRAWAPSSERSRAQAGFTTLNA